MNALTVLVAIVFAAQLVVLSLIAPYWLHKAYKDLQQRYPPETHARLYPVAPRERRRYNTAIAIVRTLIVLAGGLLLFRGLLSGAGPLPLARTMLAVALAQTLPVWLRLPEQMRIVRALRLMPVPAVRSADLRRLRVTDFVSPWMVALGFGANAVALLTAAALSRMPTAHVRTATVLYVVIVSGITLARMLYVTFMPLSMPRPDPYMSDQDVFRARRLRLRTLFGGGAFLGVFLSFAQLYAMGALHLDVVDVCIGTSVFCQLVYLLAVRGTTRVLATRDGSVYRLDATTRA
jgi:hypothetical protein